MRAPLLVAVCLVAWIDAACSNRGSSNSDHPTGSSAGSAGSAGSAAASGSAASSDGSGGAGDPGTRSPTNAGGGSAGSAGGSATAPTAPTGSPASTGPAVADAVRARICAAEPCGGPMSSIDVYRDAKGNVKKLFRLYGRCSHNPAIYFDPDGKQTEIIPEKPIVPGSAEAQEIQAKHDKQIGGLTKAESLGCR